MIELVVGIVILVAIVIFKVIFKKDYDLAYIGFIIGFFSFAIVNLFVSTFYTHEEDNLSWYIQNAKEILEYATDESYETLDEAVQDISDKYTEKIEEIEIMQEEHYPEDMLLDDIESETEQDFGSLKDAVNYLLDYYCEK